MANSVERFTGKADIYAKHRPTYPAALYDWLYGNMGFSKDSAIADIGAGTGLFTAPLIAQGSTVYTVEPNADMRAKAILAFHDCANYNAIDAPAEHTGLPDASLDLITVAQAFHWFDADTFRTECQRILKPDGLVLLAWNLRDLASPPCQAVEDAKNTHCPFYRGRGGGLTGRDPEKIAAFYRGGVYETHVFDNPMAYDHDGFIGVNFSTSYAPKPEDPQYAAFMQDLEDIFAAYAKNGIIEMPTYTNVFIGNV